MIKKYEFVNNNRNYTRNIIYNESLKNLQKNIYNKKMFMYNKYTTITVKENKKMKGRKTNEKNKTKWYYINSPSYYNRTKQLVPRYGPNK